MTIGTPIYKVILVFIGLLIGLYIFVWATMGRFNRRQYAVVSFIIVLLVFVMFYAPEYYVILEIGRLSIPISVWFLFLSWIAAGVRRFHDMDLSGWYVLLFLVPFVNILTYLYLFLKKGKGIKMTRWD